MRLRCKFSGNKETNELAKIVEERGGAIGKSVV